MATSEQIKTLLSDITKRAAPPTTDKLVQFLDLTLLVKAGVFDPTPGRSAWMMARAIDQFPPDPEDRLIEIGTGAGGLAIYMGKKYRVKDLTAVDIMPEAIACAQANFRRHGLDIKLARSDLFGSVVENKQFDMVIMNSPTSHPAAGTDVGAITLWDHTNIKQRFLNQLHSRLATNNTKAKALLTYSRYADYDSLADLDFGDFEVDFLQVSKGALAEAGVLLLTKRKGSTLANHSSKSE